MILLLTDNLDLSICENNLGCDNKKYGYCRHPKT